jgi:hypothetical protein
MLTKSVIGALSALRGSEVLEGIFRSPRSILGANGHTKCGWYLLASSLAAGLLDRLLSILRSVFLLSKRDTPFKVRRAHRVFQEPATVCRGVGNPVVVRRRKTAR